MGGEVSDLVFAKTGPTVILLAGLQGVGKTTVCAKLAFYLKKLVLSSAFILRILIMRQYMVTVRYLYQS